MLGFWTAGACGSTVVDETGSGGTAGVTTTVVTLAASGTGVYTSTTTASSSAASVTSSGHGGSTTCYQPNDAIVAPGITSTTSPGSCTLDEVGDFLDACIGGAASESNCTAFEMTHATCFGCLVPVDANGNAAGMLPAILPLLSTTYPNLWTCEAHLHDLPQCAKPTTDYAVCALSSCQGCQSDLAFGGCLDIATSQGGICKDNIVIPPECGPLLYPDEFTDMLCWHEGALDIQSVENFALVAEVLCGP